MSDEIRDGEYVIIEDFQASVKAFDALIATAEATRKVLVDAPESYITSAQSAVVVLNVAINNAIKLLEGGITKAKEFE